MSNTNETIAAAGPGNAWEPLAAILAEMRDERIIRIGDTDVTRCMLRNLADRIEAAVKRERALLDANIARVRELEDMMGGAADALLGAAIKQKAPGNAAAMREALMQIGDCVEAAYGAPQHAVGYLAQIDKLARSALDAPSKSPSKVAAAMREALNQLRDWALLDINENAIRSDEPNYKKLVDGIIEITNAALSEPPRNCNVGTVEGQMRRKREYCKETQCSGCPANKGGTIRTDRCDFMWAQMPFDSKGKCEESTSGNGFNPKDYYEKLLEDPTVGAIFRERHGYGLSGKDERNGVK